MNGLCGWFAHEPCALPISRIAPRLGGQQLAPRAGEHGAGALALAAGPGSGSILHAEGSLVAVWGHPAVLHVAFARSPADAPETCRH